MQAMLAPSAAAIKLYMHPWERFWLSSLENPAHSGLDTAGFWHWCSTSFLNLSTVDILDNSLSRRDVLRTLGYLAASLTPTS